MKPLEPSGPPGNPAWRAYFRTPSGLAEVVAPSEPKVWFTSTESFAKVLSAGNRDLLRVIAEKVPGSLDELAHLTGKAKSNLSRTLRTMESHGLVRLVRGERGRIAPKVVHDRVELQLPLVPSRKAS